MDLALMARMASFGPKKDGAIFLHFLGAPMILYCKKCVSGG
jgi:hypothetical protein